LFLPRQPRLGCRLASGLIEREPPARAARARSAAHRGSQLANQVGVVGSPSLRLVL
jgi:hypothetical protein